MANHVRGEVTIRLGGRKVVLRPTFEAIANAEDNMGRGIMAVMVDLERRDFRLKDAVTIIAACAVSDHRMTKADIGQAVMDTGLAAFVVPIGELVAGVVGGAPEEENPSPGTGSGS